MAAGAIVLVPALLGTQVLRAQQATASAPPPTFKAATALVQVDVVVRDGKGQFVGNLTKDDFQVSEDGKPQTIETFTLVGSPRGATATTAGGVAPGAPAAARAPAAAPATRPIFIFVFDDEHLEPGAFKNVQKAAEEFLRTHFTANAIGGVVANGRMAGNHLTTDREELLKAIEALKPSGKLLFQKYDLRDWPRLLSIEEAEQIVAGNSEVLQAAVLRASREEPQGRQSEDPTGAVLEKAQQITAQARPATDRMLNTLAVLMSGLARFEGPKSVIFLSEGFFTDESWPALQQVIGLAARAHTRIYSIDARGLNFANMADPTQAIANSQGDELGMMLSDSDAQNDGPNSLAVDTGGFAIRHTNQFAQAMNQIADDTTTYYLVGYRPTNTAFDGKFRKISVKVDRPGVIVRARRGYLAVPPPATTIATTTSAPPAVQPPAPVAKPVTPPAQPGAVATPADQPAAAPATAAAASAPAAEARVQPELRPAAVQHVATLEGTRLSPATASSQIAQNAWTLYQKGDLEGAEVAFEKAMVSDPAAHPWVHYAYGLTEYGLGRFPQAIRQWEMVRKASPDFEPVYFDLADGYSRSGDRQPALKTLRAAQDRWPKDAEVDNALGVIQVSMGVLDGAVQSFQQAVKTAPGDGLGYFNLGKALELRYYKSRHFVTSTNSWTANADDRRQAIVAFEKYLKIGGPFADSANTELQRLQFEANAAGPR